MSIRPGSTLVALRIPRDKLALIDVLAARAGMTRSSMIRWGIDVAVYSYFRTRDDLPSPNGDDRTRED